MVPLGGQREGSGRKPKEHVKKMVSLSPEVAAKLDEVGTPRSGKQSALVEELLRKHFKLSRSRS